PPPCPDHPHPTSPSQTATQTPRVNRRNPRDHHRPDDTQYRYARWESSSDPLSKGNTSGSDSPRWRDAAGCCPEDNAPDTRPTSSHDHRAETSPPDPPADSPAGIAPSRHKHAPRQMAAFPRSDIAHRT